ncbi:MAG: translation initiation factor [Polyangiales bacterium]
MAPPTKPANPFGALAALRDALPPGEAKAPTEAPAPTASDPVARLLAARAVVARERKGRGGKTATLVRFPDGADAGALDALAREVRQALGTGAQAEEGAVAVQGDLVERVADWLAKRGAKRVVRG